VEYRSAAKGEMFAEGVVGEDRRHGVREAQILFDLAVLIPGRVRPLGAEVRLQDHVFDSPIRSGRSTRN
jgi:hypothetical protein